MQFSMQMHDLRAWRRLRQIDSSRHLQQQQHVACGSFVDGSKTANWSLDVAFGAVLDTRAALQRVPLARRGSKASNQPASSLDRFERGWFR
jgi:hypothetical protein